MIKKCPVCEGALDKLSETKLYCAKDDITFSFDKGKIKIDAGSQDGKGELEKLTLELADQKMTLDKVIKKLFGEKADVKEFWE